MERSCNVCMVRSVCSCVLSRMLMRLVIAGTSVLHHWRMCCNNSAHSCAVLSAVVSTICWQILPGKIGVTVETLRGAPGLQGRNKRHTNSRPGRPERFHRLSQCRPLLLLPPQTGEHATPRPVPQALPEGSADAHSGWSSVSGSTSTNGSAGQTPPPAWHAAPGQSARVVGFEAAGEHR